MDKIIDRFLVLEGLDGAGTTTQKERLKTELERMGYEVCTTFEPTDGEIGRLIRKVLKGDLIIPELSLAHLFASDRANHIYGKDGIVENVRSNKIVISDRYFYSTLAYQSFSLDMEKIRQINDFPHPQYLIFIDTDPHTCIERINSRGQEKEIYEKENLLREIRNKYLKAFENLPKEVKLITIDGSLSIEDTTKSIMAKLSF